MSRDLTGEEWAEVSKIELETYGHLKNPKLKYIDGRVLDGDVYAVRYQLKHGETKPKHKSVNTALYQRTKVRRKMVFFRLVSVTTPSLGGVRR